MNPERSKHLDIPAESNRDKHTDFLAQENGDTDPGADFFGTLFGIEDTTEATEETDDED